jgi:hypothetical protein
MDNGRTSTKSRHRSKADTWNLAPRRQLGCLGIQYSPLVWAGWKMRRMGAIQFASSISLLFGRPVRRTPYARTLPTVGGPATEQRTILH